MSAAEVYSRKVSSEEAREGYVMVLKDRLSFFPPVGVAFDLDDEGQRASSRVESRACECRGPELPHEHYFVRREGLATGDRVEFERADATRTAYRLRIIR